MRIAPLKSRTARSRSPLRAACWPLAMSAATLALIGLVRGDRGACGAAARDATPADGMIALSGGGPPYGVALPTTKSSAGTGGRLKVLDGARPEVRSPEAVKRSSQEAPVSVFGVSAAGPRPEAARVQGLGSYIDDPHAAAIVVVVSDSAANAA